MHWYIFQGFDKPRTFIATQGPKAITTNDFWRMTWEQESSVIVMLTNVIEGGRVRDTTLTVFINAT